MRLKIITPLGEFYIEYGEYKEEEFENLGDVCKKVLTLCNTLDHVRLDMGNGNILLLPSDVVRKSVFVLEKMVDNP